MNKKFFFANSDALNAMLKKIKAKSYSKKKLYNDMKKIKNARPFYRKPFSRVQVKWQFINIPKSLITFFLAC